MPTFQDLLAHAEKKRRTKPSQAYYWDGYIRGLYIGHYGHDSGLDGRPKQAAPTPTAMATATSQG
jgi:hypothetical protein